MNTVYVLDAKLYAGMLEQCRQAAPAEACGLLGGPGHYRATRLIPLVNLDASAESYRMDPGEVLCTMQLLDREGLELNAVYHSHPATEAYPSAVDISQAYLPVLYLILSLCGDEPVLRGFWIEGSSVSEIPVRVAHESGEDNAE
ncbi:MAG: M67 family metallopeptidase [Bacillota bacterium]